jgi:hypothetical protein
MVIAMKMAVPEDSNLHTHCPENLKSYMAIAVCRNTKTPLTHDAVNP